MNFRKIYCIAAMALMCCTGSMFTSCATHQCHSGYGTDVLHRKYVYLL